MNIKRAIKKKPYLVNMYKKLFTFLFRLAPLVPYRATLGLSYYISTGKQLDFVNPKGFDQKIQWLKAYYHNPLIAVCSDKYSVRNYLRMCGLGEILNDIYQVVDEPEQLDFLELPNQFVIKMTNGCGKNIIVRNKASLQYESTSQRLHRYTHSRTGSYTGEEQYSLIEPRIIVEKYLGSEDKLPTDYKVFCFNGTPYCVCAQKDRNIETCANPRMHFFDLEWKPLGIARENVSSSPDLFNKPMCLNDMIKVAEALSKPFPFVRVDLYEINGKVVFGEMTFTPTGGYTAKIYTDEANIELGSKLLLPVKEKTNKWNRKEVEKAFESVGRYE